MYRFCKILFALFFALGCCYESHAQVSISASIDSSSILMGNQTVVHLHISQPQKLALEYPVINDILTSGVYVVNVTGDTIADDETITINNDITLTVFEPGSYTIPPFVCKEFSKEYSTQPLKLEVRDLSEHFEVGKMPEDIKNVENPPHSKILWVAFFASIVLLILLSVFSFFYWKKHKKDPEPYVRNSAVTDSDNPEQTALDLIQKLVDEKKWLPVGNEKRYYSELTDILRQYFYCRYSINALEMTSSELIDALRKTDMPNTLIEDVRDICITGDMTKFAKHKPTDEECIHCAQMAEQVVRETIIVKEPTEPVAGN